MTTKKIASAILMASIVAACASPQEQRQTLREATLAEGFAPIAADELNTLFADATLSGSTGEYEWQTYFGVDQAQRGFAKGSDWEETDQGTYKITPDGKFCRTWTKWRNGEETCAEVYRKDDSLKLLVVSGKMGNEPQLDAVVQTGNPFEL